MWRASLIVLALVGAVGCTEDSPSNPGTVPPLPEGRFVLPQCSDQVGPYTPISTRCQQLVDGEGRVVYLHGVNARVEGVFDVELEDVEFGGVMYTDRVPLEDIPEFLAEDATRMRQMGFNVLRLPMQWSAVEPTDEMPPAYDDTYLEGIRDVIELCEDAGVWVLLDFHQDAFSKEIGEDGAPLWAIQPPPSMLLEGPLDDLADRRVSEDVFAAWETFFGDEPTGVMLRARFAQMAAYVAAFFADNDTVFGIEIFNEPQPSGGGVAVPELANAQIVPFNIQVAEAIRAANDRHLILFEPPVVPRNFIDESGLSDAPFPVGGAVYAPHVYTISFEAPDSERRSTFTRETLRVGNLTVFNEAVSWGTPAMITEFGYDPEGIRAQEYLRTQLDLHAEYGASDAFWLWKEDSQDSWGLHDFDVDTETWIERPFVRQILSRPKPEAIAGQPQTWTYDWDTQVLEVWFRGDADVMAPNLIYVPEAADYPSDFIAECDGLPVEVMRDPANGQIEVPCGGAGDHHIAVRPE